MEEIKPRVLVGAPTSKLHDYIIDRYIANISKFTYPNFDVCFVDTSEEEWLKTTKINNGKYGILRCKPESKNVFLTLANARNMLIEHMLENNYKYFMMIDTDTLPPADCIERLMSYGKDLVGFLNYSSGKINSRPVVFKSGTLVKKGKRGLDWYSEEEISQMKGLTKVWGTSVGCLLAKREVFEKGVRFRCNNYFTIGEDIWFFIDANSAGFEFWLDPYRVIHEGRYHPRILETMQTLNNLQLEKITKADLSARLKRQELLMADLIRKLKEKKVIE